VNYPGDRRLCTFDKVARPDTFKSMMAGVVALDPIRENWTEVLRLAATIRAGDVAPSTLLAKLAAYPRQNALARALNEVGKIGVLGRFVQKATLRNLLQINSLRAGSRKHQ